MAYANLSTKPVAQDAFLSAADLKGLIEKQQQAKAAKEKKSKEEEQGRRARKKSKEEEQAAKKALIDELMIPVQVTEQQVVNAVSKFRDAAAAGQN